MRKLTEVEMRALRAVADGKVTRRYRRDGNTIERLAGIGASTILRLEAQRLIEEARDGTVGLVIVERFVLTPAGRAALAEGER